MRWCAYYLHQAHPSEPAASTRAKTRSSIGLIHRFSRSKSRKYDVFTFMTGLFFVSDVIPCCVAACRICGITLCVRVSRGLWYDAFICDTSG